VERLSPELQVLRPLIVVSDSTQSDTDLRRVSSLDATVSLDNDVSGADDCCRRQSNVTMVTDTSEASRQMNAPQSLSDKKRPSFTSGSAGLQVDHDNQR